MKIPTRNNSRYNVYGSMSSLEEVRRELIILDEKIDVAEKSLSDNYTRTKEMFSLAYLAEEAMRKVGSVVSMAKSAYNGFSAVLAMIADHRRRQDQTPEDEFQDEQKTDERA